MRRQRLLTITLVSFLLLCLTVICANASWFIQDKIKGSGSATNVGSALQEGEQNPIFQTTYNYTGNELTLEYLKDGSGNSLGQDLFGDISKNLEIVCNSATASGASRSSLGDRFNSLMKDQNGNYLVKHAGTYTFSIKDKTTGQMIYTNLKVVINPLQVEYTTPIPAYTFEGEYGTVTYQMQYTNAAGTVVTLDTVYSATTTGQVATGAYGAGKTGTTPPTAETFLNFTLNAQISEEVAVAGGSTAINPAFNNYISPTSLSYQNFKFFVLPTCYTYAKSTATFYGSLDAAFGSSHTLSNTTLVAMAGFTYNDGTTNHSFTATGATQGDYTHSLSGGTIESGAKLIIPYKKSTSFNASVEKYDKTDRYASSSTSTDSDGQFGDANDGFAATPVCVNEVILTGTLINNGTVEICGINGYPRTWSEVPQASTTGNHATLTMKSNAYLKMNNTSASMTVLGYIANDNNTAGVEIISGTVTLPFVIYDYHGATVTIGMYAGTESGKPLTEFIANNTMTKENTNVSPFTIFDMPNIQAKLVCHGGTNKAKIQAVTSLYSGAFGGGLFKSQYNLAEFYMLSDASSAALIKMENGTATFEHEATYKKSGYLPQTNEQTTITLCGDTTSGDISMPINLGTIDLILTEIQIGATVSLSTVNFPISSKFALVLDGGGEQNQYEYAFTSGYKFLPGSELRIQNHAQVKTTENGSLMFYQATHEGKHINTWTTKTGATIEIYNYYQGAFSDYMNAATCSIGSNSTLTVLGGLGGEIALLDNTVTLDLTGASTLRPSELEGTGSKTGGTTDAKMLFVPMSTAIELPAKAAVQVGPAAYETQELGKFNYTGTSVNTTPVLFKPAVDITLDASGGAFTDGLPQKLVKDIEIDANGLTAAGLASLLAAETPNLPGYNFVEWRTEDGTKIENATSQIHYNTTLYAYYEQASVTATITYGDVSAPTDATGTYEAVATPAQLTGLSLTNGSFTIPAETANNADVSFSKYLQWTATWTINGSTYTGNTYKAGATVSISEAVASLGIDVATIESCSATMTATWEKKTEFTFNLTKATVTVTYNATTISSGPFYAIPGDTFTAQASFTESGDRSFKIGTTNYKDSQSAETYIVPASTSAIEIYAYSKSSGICIVEGTLITLADGTQKKVEDLTYDDLVLVFNHETGKMEPGYIAMLDHLDMERFWTNVINLSFSNGETLRVVWNHGVFDATLNRYVMINEDNYKDFVGHEFYSSYYNGSEFVSETVTLTEAFITHEYIKVYNPTTLWHMNYFANGILNVTAAPADHVGGHVNIFELDENMMYDKEKMQADIEKYGLYTYEDFAELLTEEQFQALPFAYLKVAVEKGTLSWNSVLQIVEYIQAGSLLD